MLIVQVWGGLGNQMFQYAFARGAAQKLGERFCLDTSFFLTQDPAWRCCIRNYELERIFALRPEHATADRLTDCRRRALFNWTIGRRTKIPCINPYRRDRDEKFSERHWTPIWPAGRDILYKGYWQSPRYFDFMADEIREDFQIVLGRTPDDNRLLAEIGSCESVSIHFRRTDYLNSPSEKGLAYYRQALEEVKRRVKNPRLFAFSDDMAWVIENFRPDIPITYVDGLRDQGLDLELMRRCKHNIIANSSFSWWGAWLNPNPQKIVLAPKPYNNRDIYPDGWIVAEK